MFLNDFTVETENAIINISEGTINWKEGMFNPKAQKSYKAQIERFQKTNEPIYSSDFKF